jgi:adenylylsulfate kinase-like enzyme
LLGPTSSGKTTIATELLLSLRKKGTPVIHYDGDEVRDLFGDSIGFSTKERFRVVNTLVHLANKSVDAGLNVIVSALTANHDVRKFVKNRVNKLIVGYVKCSIEECIRRDPKGLYSKAQKGEIDTLIGFNQEYCVPENPDIIIETEIKSLTETIIHLEDFLYKNKAV